MVDTTKTILSKKETVYGTDAVPTPAANAVVTRNFTTEPLVVDTLERNLDVPTRGRSKTSNTNRRTTLGYEVELSGSGAAGTAAPFMEHLEQCGMAAPVLTAGTKAEQKFAAIGALLSSMTHYHWHGVQRRRALGTRGTFGLDFTAGAMPFAKLDLTGLLPPLPAEPVDEVAPGAVPNFARWIEPVEVNTANTDFTLDGYALVLKQFTAEIGAEVKPRNLVGANYIQRGNHAITGKIVGECPNVGSKNYFNRLDSGAEIAIALNHGIVAGNIVDVEGSYLQILKIGLMEEDDVLMVDISYGLNVRTGSDDLLIRAR